MMTLGIAGRPSFPKQYLEGKGPGAVVPCSQKHCFLFPAEEVRFFPLLENMTIFPHYA